MSTIWKFTQSALPTALKAADLPYSSLMLRLLQLKQLHFEENIQTFLFPSLDGLYDPILMKGMDVATKRILSAINQGKTILVHGDYDADGITGTAVLSRMLEKLNAKFITFLPVRKRDGYGVSQEAIGLAKEK